MSKGAALRLTADGMRATRLPPRKHHQRDMLGVLGLPPLDSEAAVFEAARHGVHVNTAARQASGISAYSEGGRTRAEPLPVLSMAWLPRELVVESRGSKSMRSDR